MKTFPFRFIFNAWIPGGFSGTREYIFHCDARDYATAVNKYNEYVYTTFRGLRTEVVKIIKDKRIIPL